MRLSNAAIEPQEKEMQRCASSFIHTHRIIKNEYVIHSREERRVENGCVLNNTNYESIYKEGIVLGGIRLSL